MSLYRPTRLSLSENMETAQCKVLLVGDSYVGKSAILNAFLKPLNGFNQVYTPTIFENYSVVFRVDKYRIELSLWDTSGKPHYNSVRPLTYPDSDVVLICYDISVPESLNSVVNQWYTEVRKYCHHCPIVLVGCKSDLRNDINVITELAERKQIPLSHETGTKISLQIGAVGFVECSAKNSEISVREVFEVATLAAKGKLNLHKSFKGLPRRRLSLRRKSEEPEQHKLHIKSTVLETSPTKSADKSCVIM